MYIYIDIYFYILFLSYFVFPSFIVPYRVLPLSLFIFFILFILNLFSFLSVFPMYYFFISLSLSLSLSSFQLPLLSFLLRHFLRHLAVFVPVQQATVTSAPCVSAVSFIPFKLACKPRRLMSKLSCFSSHARSHSQWTYPSACILGVRLYYRYYPSRKQLVSFSLFFFLFVL